MTAQTKAANKAKFETGDTPSEADFADLIDSYQDVLAEGAFVDGDKTKLDAAVSKVGTPADNQVAVWTGDGTAEGATALLWDGDLLKILDGTVDAAAWPDTSAKLAVYGDSTDLDLLFGIASATAGNRVIANFARARGADVANPAAVADNDYLGSIQARGYASGGTFPIGARIDFMVDGSPGASAVPAEMLFSTGQSLGSLAVRMRIAATGGITFHGEYTFPAADGTSGQVLTTDGSGALSWGTPAGGGDVAKVGTPVANRMAYWTGDGTLGHESGFTYDPDTDTLTVTKIVIGGITFDGEGQLTDPDADRLIGWDDSAGTTAYFAPTGGLEISGTDLQLTAAYRTEIVSIQVFDAATDVTTGDGAGGVLFRVPSKMNGWDLVAVAASVGTAGTTGTTDVQVHNVTQTADMLTTKITIDSAETDSATAAAAAVIDTGNDDVATGDKIRIDVDAVSTTKPKGLWVELQFRAP